MEDLRYPVGKYIEQPFSETQLKEWLLDIQSLPQQIEYAITNLDHHQQDTPYRDGGWTVKQVVHHVADSHMNAYIRFKLGLTEETPAIKPYDEARWAELQDASGLDIEVSLVLLDALHRRWIVFLKSLNEEQFKRIFHHPETGVMTMDRTLGLYAWHGRHHIAHIDSLRKRMGW